MTSKKTAPGTLSTTTTTIPAKETDQKDDRFPIVGIGASAGGLAALFPTGIITILCG